MSAPAGGRRFVRPGWGSRLLWVVYLAAAAVTAVAYLSPYTAPGGLWPVAFAALAYPSLVALLLLLSGYWLYRGRFGRAALGPIVVALGYTHLRALVGLGGGAAASPDATPVAFVSYNLLGGKTFRGLEGAALDTRAGELAGCLEADVLAVQESPRYEVVADAVRDALAADGLGYAYRPGSPAIALYARYPLLRPAVVEQFNSLNGILRADMVVTPDDTVRLLVAHLESNRVRLDASQVAREVAKADPQAYRTVRGVAANYRLGARRRGIQSAVVTAEVAASPYPVVLLGDLNDVPLSYTLGELRRGGLVDAFREAGSGLGVTYEGSIPGLRIDFVMATPQLAPVAASVLDCDFSDHRPTRAVLAVGD